jgi:hypothetical protein
VDGPSTGEMSTKPEAEPLMYMPTSKTSPRCTAQRDAAAASCPRSTPVAILDPKSIGKVVARCAS